MKTVEVMTFKDTMVGGGSSEIQLPDVTSRVIPEISGHLDWVGMESMEFPVRIPFEGETFLSLATVDGFVSLDNPSAKGIHMSRIYKLCWEMFESKKTLSLQMLQLLSEEMIQSQKNLSEASQLTLRLTWPLQRKALKSKLKGFRGYPVEIKVLNSPEGMNFSVQMEVLYSSTCPCSAALARQLNSDHFFETFKGRESFSKADLLKWFAEESSVKATPHAQRSIAHVELLVGQDFTVGQITDEINCVETALATAVQTAVKREDEQEFARLNAENLMFCEDAARRIKVAFQSRKDLLDFSIKVNHQESLHSHDAVAYASKDHSN